MSKKVKNIAIIAHVDHGKTTLVDAMLKQSGVFRSNQQVEERVMDSNDIERERGITIFSKNASLLYKDYKINIVDTPGHADFGGEVQRIMKMVDSVLLVVDAFEGPMPQTKYVLKNSLALGLNPIVVINKIDRPHSQPEKVLDMVFDLFVELNANEEQLDFPVVYASAKNGFAKRELEDENKDISPILDVILENVRDPKGDAEKPFQFLVSAIDYDNYLGKMGTGRIHNGSVHQGDEVVLMTRDEKNVPFKITKLFSYEGMKRVEIEEAHMGDIITIAGAQGIDVGETVADKDHPEQLPIIEIDEPTLAMTFMPNDSPFMGKEGKYVTSTAIWDRLQRELQANISLRVERGVNQDAFIVKGRGELQLSILIENMRREGYEFQVSRPEVIYKKDENGHKLEPVESVIVDVSDEYSGVVIEMLGHRKGIMSNMAPGTDGYTRLEFLMPARGLIGFRGDFLTATRGTGILNSSFYGYEPYAGDFPTRNRGVLVQLENAKSIAYGLSNLQERGTLFIGPGVDVYAGMIIGENSREGDMVVNTGKGKKLTNTRASGSDDAVRLEPPKVFSLEQALEYIDDDELIEVTPLNIRMRKKVLDHTQRRRSSSNK